MASQSFFRVFDNLPSAYDRAAEHIRAAKRSKGYPLGDQDFPMHMGRAADELCQALSVVLGSQSFFDGYNEYVKEASENWGGVLEQLENSEDFLAMEYEIFKAANMSDESANELLLDIADALAIARQQPGPPQMQNLKRRFGDVREAVCRAANELKPGSSDSGRQLDLPFIANGIFRGLSIIAGGTGIVTNAIMVSNLCPYLASVTGGIAVIGQSIRPASPVT